MASSIMSSQIQRYLIKTVNMGAKIGCVPFRLNSECKLSKQQSKLVMLTTKLNTANAFALPVFLMGRYVHWILSRDPTNPKEMRSGMVIMFVLIMTLHGATTMLHMAANYEVHRGFVKMMITFFRSAKGQRKTKGSNGCERYLQGFWLGMRLTIAGGCAVLFLKPQRVHTFMSIFNEPYKQPFFVPVTLANYAFLTLCIVMSHYSVVIPIVYIFAMHTKINTLKSAVTSQWTMSVHFAHNYRSAQLLQRYFNALWGTWLLPLHENLCIAGSVMGIYGLERMIGPIRGVWGVIMLLNIFHLSFAYNKMGQLHEDSRKLLEVAGSVSKVNARWLRRFLSSCRPITVTHGSMFFVDKGLVLTIWSTIACSAINLLVTQH